MIWKKIDDHYEVSRCGVVRSVDRVTPDKNGQEMMFKGVVLKPGLDGGGYLRVSLCARGTGKTQKVHRLVAEAFIENPDNLPQVNHIDEDKGNNHVDNLEWCTNQHNSEHSLAKHYVLISPDGERVEVFNLQRFCRENGLNPGNIRHVRKGNRPHHKQWRVAC